MDRFADAIGRGDPAVESHQSTWASRRVREMPGNLPDAHRDRRGEDECSGLVCARDPALYASRRSRWRASAPSPLMCTHVRAASAPTHTLSPVAHLYCSMVRPVRTLPRRVPPACDVHSFRTARACWRESIRRHGTSHRDRVHSESIAAQMIESNRTTRDRLSLQS